MITLSIETVPSPYITGNGSSPTSSQDVWPRVRISVEVRGVPMESVPPPTRYFKMYSLVL